MSIVLEVGRVFLGWGHSMLCCACSRLHRVGIITEWDPGLSKPGVSTILEWGADLKQNLALSLGLGHQNTEATEVLKPPSPWKPQISTLWKLKPRAPTTPAVAWNQKGRMEA